MSELACEMQISKQQLTPLICKLIDSDLLVRRTDENDRRIIRLEATESGKSICSELHREIKMAVVGKLKTIPETELEELEKMLKRIHALLKNNL